MSEHYRLLQLGVTHSMSQIYDFKRKFLLWFLVAIIWKSNLRKDTMKIEKKVLKKKEFPVSRKSDTRLMFMWHTELKRNH